MGKGLAITAFILSLLFFLPLVPIIGMILAIISLAKSKDTPNSGVGWAIAAIVIGLIFGITSIGLGLSFIRGFFF